MYTNCIRSGCNTLDKVRKENLSAEKAAQFAYHLLPLADLNHERSGMAPRPVLYALIAVGILLVLAACINYINLATAQALQRAREVGVRKVVGSNRLQLVKQFLLETALLTGIAVVIALMLTQLAMPLVNQTLAKQVDMLHLAISVIIHTASHRTSGCSRPHLNAHGYDLKNGQAAHRAANTFKSFSQ